MVIRSFFHPVSKEFYENKKKKNLVAKEKPLLLPLPLQWGWLGTDAKSKGFAG